MVSENPTLFFVYFCICFTVVVHIFAPDDVAFLGLGILACFAEHLVSHHTLVRWLAVSAETFTLLLWIHGIYYWSEEDQRQLDIIY